MSFFQIFHFRVDQENRLSNMFPQEVLPQMFANIKSIYKFHAEFLLPQVSIKYLQKQTDKLVSHNGAFLSSQKIFDKTRPPYDFFSCLTIQLVWLAKSDCKGSRLLSNIV